MEVYILNVSRVFFLGVALWCMVSVFCILAEYAVYLPSAESPPLRHFIKVQFLFFLDRKLYTVIFSLSAVNLLCNT